MEDELEKQKAENCHTLIPEKTEEDLPRTASPVMRYAVWSTMFFFAGISILLLVTQRADKSPDESDSIRPSASESEVHVTDTQFKGPAVHYKDGIFSPSEMTLEESDSNPLGCLLNIINETQEDMIVRLGPFEKGKEKGFPYAPIPAGESLIIDPRYTGIDRAVFYNTKNPKEEFAVVIDKSCM